MNNFFQTPPEEQIWRWYFEKYPLSSWKPFPILQYTWLDLLSDMRTSSSFIFQSVSLRRRLCTYCSSSFFRWITSLLPLPPPSSHYMEEKKGGREACTAESLREYLPWVIVTNIKWKKYRIKFKCICTSVMTIIFFAICGKIMCEKCT